MPRADAKSQIEALTCTQPVLPMGLKYVKGLRTTSLLFGLYSRATLKCFFENEERAKCLQNCNVASASCFAEEWKSTHYVPAETMSAAERSD